VVLLGGRWCGSCGRRDRHWRRGLLAGGGACGELAGQADQIGMGWFSRTTDEGGQMADQLTAQDRADFMRLNEAVGRAAKAAKAVLDGGRALAEIRDRQLFRTVGKTWEKYLEAHGLTRRRADQIIAAAAVFEAVEEVSQKVGTTVPTLSERALRPLVGLPAEQAVEAVAEAASSPAGITPATIRQAAGRRKKTKAAKAPRPRRFKVPGGIVVVELNAKAAAAGINVEAALLAALEAVRRDGQAEAA